MGAQDEEAVRAFLAEAEGEKWDATQIERMLNRMTPDIRYHVYAWERPVVGQDAVRAELLRQAPLFADFRSEIVAMASVNFTVFVERRDSFSVGRKHVTRHVAAVFEVDGDGNIGLWRDYYDSSENAAKLGIDVTRLRTAGARGHDTVS